MKDMKIQTKFLLIITIIGFCFLFAGFSLLDTMHRIQILDDEIQKSNLILTGSYELSYLTNDHLFHPYEKRQNIQWRSRFTKLSETLLSLKVQEPAESVLADRIQKSATNLDSIYTGFVETIEIGEQKSGFVDPDLIPVIWSRSIVQTQGMISDATQLSESLRSRASVLHQRNDIEVLVLFCLSLLVLVFFSVFIYRQFISSLSDLREGFQAVGSGNLNYQLPVKGNDEFGEVSSLFNQMTGDLRRITTSVSNLTAEIAKREATEEELRKSEERYRGLFSSMSLGVAVYIPVEDGEDFIFTDFNPAAEKIDQLPREAVIDRSVRDVFPRVVDFGLFSVFQRVARTGVPEQFPISLYRDERIEGWRDNFVFRLSSGELVTVYRDSTEQKQAEDRMRRELTLNETLLDLYQMIDAPEQEIYNFALDGCQKITGSRYSFIGKITPDESMMNVMSWSHSVMDSCSVTDKDIHFPIASAGIWGDCVRFHEPVLINDYSADYPGKHGIPDGHVEITRFLEVPIIVGTGLYAVLAVANKKSVYTDEDIGALKTFGNMMAIILVRKETEHALLRKNRELAAAKEEMELKNTILSTQLETTVDGILIVDQVGTVLRYSQNFLDIWRIPEDLIHLRSDEKLLQYVTDQCLDPDAFLSRVRYLYSHEQEKSFEEILLTDGRVLERFSAPMIGKEGVYYGRVWYFRDITDRKRIEENLVNSEVRFRRLFEAAKDGILIIDYHTEKIIDANPFIADILGYPLSEIIGKALWEIGTIPDIFTSKQLFSELKKNTYVRYEGLPLVSVNGIHHDVEFISNVYAVDHTKVIQCNIRDITERKIAEQKLRDNEEQLSFALEVGGFGTWKLNLETGSIIRSPLWDRIFGYDDPSIEWTYDRFLACVLPEDHNEISEKMKETIRTLIPWDFECRIILRDSEIRWIWMKGMPMSGQTQDINTITGLIQDITERRRLQEDLENLTRNLEIKVNERTRELEQSNTLLEKEIKQRRISENISNTRSVMLNAIFESTPDGIIAVDTAGKILKYNTHFVSMWHISPSHIPIQEITLLMGDIIPLIEDPEIFIRKMEFPSSGSDAYNYGLIELKTGQFFEYYSSPQIRDDEKIGSIWSFRDVTSKRKMELQLESSLNEKEMLLKEIHHRVKNNMQVISSLLFMQARRITDEKAKEILRESQNRIKSIALVHEKVYQSESLDRIDYNDYLKKITMHVFESYLIDPNQITLHISSEKVFLPVDKAVPCSLVINELLSNSLKYAFPDNRTGTIDIEMTCTDDRYLLVYRDDGVGIPKDTDFVYPKTLGFELIQGLVRQINGTIEQDRTNGTGYTILFPA
ncbi:MAG: PAS domain S-box protein [Methanospirillaceae archaeon]|nr:PAS domain S-box protein [Methanospirillaceae archaeon]